MSYTSSLLGSERRPILSKQKKLAQVFGLVPSVGLSCDPMTAVEIGRGTLNRVSRLGLLAFASRVPCSHTCRSLVRQSAYSMQSFRCVLE